MTTKGSLVRSMLFPKTTRLQVLPGLDAFHRRLTGIAGIGFMASAVQFVRLGVSEFKSLKKYKFTAVNLG